MMPGLYLDTGPLRSWQCNLALLVFKYSSGGNEKVMIKRNNIPFVFLAFFIVRSFNGRHSIRHGIKPCIVFGLRVG